MPGVGQMTAKAIIDTKEGEDALNRLDMSAAKFSKRLESIGNRPLSVLQKLKGELTDIRFAMDQATDPTTLKRLSAEYEAVDRKIMDATGKSFMYRKQQMREEQMYTMRSVALLMSLSMIYNQLSGSEEDQAGKQKEVNKALREGVETTTGAAFALMMMGGKAAEMALPIGAAVGVLMALWHILRDVDEAAESASKQGLKDYVDLFKQLPIGAQKAQIASMEEMLKSIYANPASVTKEKRFVQGEGYVTFETKNYSEQQKTDIEYWSKRKQAAEDALRYEAQLAEQHKKDAAQLAKNQTDLQRWQSRIAEIQTELGGTGSGEKRRELLDEQLELQGKINDANLTTNDLIQKQKDYEERIATELQKIEDQKIKDARESIQHEKNLIEAGRQTLQDAITSLEVYRATLDNAKAIEIVEAEIGNLKKRQADEAKKAAEERYKELENTLTQAQRTARLLERAFNKAGDDFLAKLAMALEMAANIARVLNAANKKEGGAGLLDYLEIGASIASTFTLFDEGGWTGPGQRSKVAGFVHADEIVFEKPIVERYRPELMGLRAAMGGGRGNYRNYQGYAGGGFTGSSSGGSMMIGDLSPVLNELKGLRSDIVKITGGGSETSPRFVTLEKALVTAYPPYIKKDKDKHV